MRRIFLVLIFFLFAIPAFAQKIDYVMPYPGILPDHPLYSVKLVRDRLLDFLIVEPARKAEFYILQADKRLMMGVMLFDKGKGELAETTISKGEKYLLQSVERVVQVKQEGKEFPVYVVERLAKSAAKHEEILEELMGKASGSFAEGLKESAGILEKTQETVATLQ